MSLAGDLVTRLPQDALTEVTLPETHQARAPDSVQDAHLGLVPDSVVSLAGDLMTRVPQDALTKVTLPKNHQARAPDSVQDARPGLVLDSVVASAGDLMTRLAQDALVAQRKAEEADEADENRLSTPTAALLAIPGSTARCSALLVSLNLKYLPMGCGLSHTYPLIVETLRRTWRGGLRKPRRGLMNPTPGSGARSSIPSPSGHTPPPSATRLSCPLLHPHWRAL